MIRQTQTEEEERRKREMRDEKPTKLTVDGRAKVVYAVFGGPVFTSATPVVGTDGFVRESRLF